MNSMPKCCFCENNIEQGLVIGFWGPENETKPICTKCIKRFLESDGKENGLKKRIEKWIEERHISFGTINEPNHIFHFILKDIGPAKITAEVFQEKDSSEFIVGFMTFLSQELTFKIYKFSVTEKEDFKRKVDEFLASIKMDYRTGIRAGYEIISEKGHYGAKYFIKSKIHDCDKEKFFKILEKVEKTGTESDIFLNQTLRN
ncbi:MAG: DUF2299 family protein [Nitrosopumilaceae archaeon]